MRRQSIWSLILSAELRGLTLECHQHKSSLSRCLSAWRPRIVVCWFWITTLIRLTLFQWCRLIHLCCVNGYFNYKHIWDYLVSWPCIVKAMFVYGCFLSQKQDEKMTFFTSEGEDTETPCEDQRGIHWQLQAHWGEHQISHCSLKDTFPGLF